MILLFFIWIHGNGIANRRRRSFNNIPQSPTKQIHLFKYGTRSRQKSWKPPQEVVDKKRLGRGRGFERTPRSGVCMCVCVCDVGIDGLLWMHVCGERNSKPAPASLGNTCTTKRTARPRRILRCWTTPTLSQQGRTLERRAACLLACSLAPLTFRHRGEQWLGHVEDLCVCSFGSIHDSVFCGRAARITPGVYDSTDELCYHRDKAPLSMATAGTRRFARLPALDVVDAFQKNKPGAVFSF